MRWTRRRLAACLVGGLMLGGVAGSAARAGWPFTGWTIDGERFSGGPIRMMVYEKLSLRTEGTLPEGSHAAEAVRRWLADHPKDWTLDFNSYAPPPLRFKGELFTLDFYPGGVLLNYDLIGSPERSRQVSRRTVPGDVPELFGPPQAQ